MKNKALIGMFKICMSIFSFAFNLQNQFPTTKNATKQYR